MRLLVLNPRVTGPDDLRLGPLAVRIVDLLRRARFAQLPIAHLHEARNGAAALSIPIGRYDPVFKADDLARGVPIGLIDYLVASPSKTIKLVGAANRANIKRLRAMLADAGYDADVESQTIVSLDDR